VCVMPSSLGDASPPAVRVFAGEFYLLTLGVFYEEVYWLWPSN